jgi:hypothetical protein
MYTLNRHENNGGPCIFESICNAFTPIFLYDDLWNVRHETRQLCYSSIQSSEKTVPDILKEETKE